MCMSAASYLAILLYQVHHWLLEDLYFHWAHQLQDPLVDL